MNVEEEVERLKEEIKRLGKLQDDGSYKLTLFADNVFSPSDSAIYDLLLHSKAYINVTFGVLFNDDKCANIFEALVGTLRAAKKRKFLTYDGELLLQGVHDNVEIILKPAPAAVAAATSAVVT
uniref:Costars domain-containing protein n=1 Tax=Quercus lobata TaxID=97700 RepID=A0A7N2MWK8_QUELO